MLNILIIVSIVITLNLLFILSFIKVFKYLKSIKELMLYLESEHEELWLKLGSPLLFLKLNFSNKLGAAANLFKHFMALIKFMKWLLSGKIEIEDQELINLRNISRELLKNALVYFLLTFIAFILVFGVSFFVIGTLN